ncbi:hypothetical protein [Deinococcus hopiensis]|uniref:Uncharacterized protein n=1 Tax=Deinococcus hopiensis KR-140 TaxID=695939 RepID=A0A1W1VDX5_9DEIO|nr:hypothetical protein [Deinococcus hopiensis]SMB91144.1 hypothetical protein SAMN00790413_01008 [Deinococcus hopiensis KR-140]
MASDLLGQNFDLHIGFIHILTGPNNFQDAKAPVAIYEKGVTGLTQQHAWLEVQVARDLVQHSLSDTYTGQGMKRHLSSQAQVSRNFEATRIAPAQGGQEGGAL